MTSVTMMTSRQIKEIKNKPQCVTNCVTILVCATANLNENQNN
jgi:hypothetical protein